MARRAVFLDRDGTLIRAYESDGRPVPAASLEAVEILPGVREGLGLLNSAGYALIVVTNQPDVARGTQGRDIVEEINQWLLRELPLDEVACCYHGDADACGCRKPAPGLIVDAAARHGIDRTASFMIGDRWRDVGAGSRAGCTTILLPNAVAEPPRCSPDWRAASFLEAARLVLHLRRAAGA